MIDLAALDQAILSHSPLLRRLRDENRIQFNAFEKDAPRQFRIYAWGIQFNAPELLKTQLDEVALSAGTRIGANLEGANSRFMKFALRKIEPHEKLLVVGPHFLNIAGEYEATDEDSGKTWGQTVVRLVGQFAIRADSSSSDASAPETPAPPPTQSCDRPES